MMKNSGESQGKIKDVIEVTDAKLITIILHKQKSEILRLLGEQALSLQEIVRLTKLNPGTVKRHLDNLIEHSLVYIQTIMKNNMKISMNMFRASAKTYKIHYSLP